MSKVNIGSCLQLLKHLLQLIKKTLYFKNPQNIFVFIQKALKVGFAGAAAAPWHP